MNKKRIIAGIAAVIVIAVLGAAIAFAYTRGQEEENLGENQRYVYAYITGIEGNEVTYTELDESVVTAYLEQQEASDENDDAGEEEKTAEEDRTAGDNLVANENSDAGAGEASQSSGMPHGDFSGGEMSSGMPGGDFSDGERPSGMLSGDGMPEDGERPSGMPGGDFSDGEMPSGMPGGDTSGNTVENSTEMPEEMEMPSGMPGGDTSGESGRGTMGGSEVVTTLIPVGVTVHTASDAETTFQRLVSGDMVKILMETNAEGEEVIIEIWML